MRGRRYTKAIDAADGGPPRPRRTLGGTLQHDLRIGMERNLAWWNRLVPLSPFPLPCSPEIRSASSYERKLNHALV